MTAFNDNPDPELTTEPGWSDLFPPVPEPRIVLTWLMRLRWLATIGQLVASCVAVLLGLHVTLTPVLLVTAITAVSNVGLWRLSRAGGRIPTVLILGVLLLDVSLLTLLLIATGGPANPFSTLYLVHVAMAVTTLGGGWTWVVLAAAGIGYALLFVVPSIRLSPQGPIRPWIVNIGLWTNLVLVGGLIAYFSSRVNRSLRERQSEIEQLQERNARHEKLATLTTLAAGAAHELGTPLATIALVARELELAISKLPESGELVEDAQLIRQECNRCRFILDRMRVEVASDTRETSTPLGELMELLSMHLTDDEKARLQIAGPQTGINIGASCAAIEQSLTVMIRNAMDAAPNTTPVKLVIRKHRAHLAFDVIDQGHGMSEDVLKRAGEPFFTTKEAGRGMGLGLFLVRLVAENYRGSFNLSSKPGEGTKSTLELPMVGAH